MHYNKCGPLTGSSGVDLPLAVGSAFFVTVRAGTAYRKI